MDDAIKQYRPPTFGESLKSAGQNLYQGAAQTVTQGNAALMAIEGKALGAIGLDKFSEQFQKASNTLGAGSLHREITGALGEEDPHLANAGILGQALAREGPQAIGSVVGLAGVPGPKGLKMGMAFRGGLVQGAQGFYEAKAKGAPELQQWEAFAANAALGATEGLNVGQTKLIGKILDRAAKGGGEPFLKRFMFEAVRGVPAEMIQEGAQQIGSNIIAKAIYDEDRKPLEGLMPTLRGTALATLLTAGLAAGMQRPQGPSASGEQTGTETASKPADQPEGVAAPTDVAPQEPTAEFQVAPETEIPGKVEGEPVEGIAQPAEEAQSEPALDGKPERGLAPGTESESVPVYPPTPEGVERTISIRNASVDQGRAEAGMQDATHGARTTFEEENARAAAILADDPEAGSRLVKELSKRARPLDATEDALLTREMVRISLERKAAVAALEQNPDSDDAAQRVKDADDAYFQVGEVATLGGTKNAQALALRRMQLREDYSIAEMQRTARVANRGRPLSDVQKAEIDAIHARIDAAEKAFDAYQAQVEKKLEAARTSDLKREVKARQRKPGAIESYLTEKANEARKRLKSAGVARDIGSVVEDVAIIGAEKIVKGTAEFAAWSKAMIDDLGEGIRQHLDAAFERAHALAEDATNKPSQDARLKGAKTRLANETEKIYTKLANEDFSKQSRKPIALDEEGIKLKAEHERAKREYSRALIRYQRNTRDRRQKAIDAAKEILDLPRAVWSAYDLSAVFRQGGFFTLGHPIQASRNIQQMLRAAKSETAASEIDAKIRTRPGYEFGKQSGLVLTELEPGYTRGKQEEAIYSQLSDKIPGVRISNRAYLTYINLQRSQMFDTLVQAIPGKPTLEQGRVIAHAVNVATGRGNIEAHGKTLDAATRVLWAPRLLVSRFQLLAGEPGWKGDAHTRKIVAKEYARFLTGLAVIYGLGSMMGGEFDEGPRSADFGKIRFGNTRLDPLAGLAQVSRFVASTGSHAAAAVGMRKLDKGDREYGEILKNFLRSKLTPTLGTGWNLLEGKNMVGEKVTVQNQLAPQSLDELNKSIYLPLSFRDIYDVMRERGVPEGAALELLQIFGMGVQHYSR